MDVFFFWMPKNIHHVETQNSDVNKYINYNVINCNIIYSIIGKSFFCKYHDEEEFVEMCGRKYFVTFNGYQP